MKCFNCGTELIPGNFFCEKCGTELNNNSAYSEASLIGNKNVIAGDVIGTKSETNISGNATIINDADETKKISKCHICGKYVRLLENYNCPYCNKFTCKDCFNIEKNNCKECISIINSSGLLPSFAKVQLSNATDLFYDEGNVQEAYKIICQLYELYPETQEILDLYFPVLKEVSGNEKTLYEINKFSADTLPANLVKLEILLEEQKPYEAEILLNHINKKWNKFNIVNIYNVLFYAAMYKNTKHPDFLKKAKELIKTFKGNSKLERTWDWKLSDLLEFFDGKPFSYADWNGCFEFDIYYSFMNKPILGLGPKIDS
ncbi:MAG: zinc ribbon domain-containing protein [Treponema sp.]|nr:zinc ribbon domain-containing protein [Treponema sp.]